MTSAVDRDVTIISNAGGVRPRSCGQALQEIATELGLRPAIGVVEGDDVMSRLAEWQQRGIDLSNMDDGRPFDEVMNGVTSANVYLGAAPVITALELGAQFIVTGRVTDTGISLAPMVHHFGWATDDFDKMAAGIVAGHILECGAQSTGGNFTNWRDVPTYHNIGYPIVEMEADGSFVVTKHEGTGGLVSIETVREQLVYEMGDPAAYLTRDVVVDFSSISLANDGPDRVRVSGVKGVAPTDLLKISTWGAAVAKPVGVRDHAPIRSSRRRPNESPGIRKDTSRADSVRPPGVAVTDGRPAAQDVVAYWPCLVPRTECQATVSIIGDKMEGSVVAFEGSSGPGRAPTTSDTTQRIDVELSGNTISVPLAMIAHGRSGDKGDTCNIGLIARHPSIYPWLVEHITRRRVR